MYDTPRRADQMSRETLREIVKCAERKRAHLNRESRERNGLLLWHSVVDSNLWFMVWEGDAPQGVAGAPVVGSEPMLRKVRACGRRRVGLANGDGEIFADFRLLNEIWYVVITRDWGGDIVSFGVGIERIIIVCVDISVDWFEGDRFDIQPAVVEYSTRWIAGWNGGFSKIDFLIENFRSFYFKHFVHPQRNINIRSFKYYLNVTNVTLKPTLNLEPWIW